MDRKTRAIIAATVVAIGIGVVALGYFEDESTVRYVADVHNDPDALASGSYTLLGIPQPAELATGPNPEHEPVVHVTTEIRDGVTHRITSTSTVAEVEPGLHRFTIHRVTTTASSQTVVEESNTTWDLVGDLRVFQVDDFETGQTVWAAFGGVLNGDIQPKPSQLQGHRADAPDGLLLWDVEPDGFTVGCSGKFLPDDVRDEYDADGDGTTD